LYTYDFKTLFLYLLENKCKYSQQKYILKAKSNIFYLKTHF